MTPRASAIVRGSPPRFASSVKSRLRYEAVAVPGRELGEQALLLRHELRCQYERRQIGLGEIPIVVAFLFGALRPDGVVLVVVQHRLLCERPTALEHGDLAVPFH